MKIKGGYFFRILRVDLSEGKTTVKRFDNDFALNYIGGRGFGIKILWDHLRKHENVDPLGPDNIVVIAPGPMTGCYLPSSGKNSFMTISPATGLYGDSSVGGSFGTEIRQAGYDAIVITGRAPELSYLFVDEDIVRIVPFPEIAGKSALETEGMIKENVGDVSIRVATIGPAGENLVKFACINSDWGRNAGRVGVGAVLGSKNLKAIVVRGAKDIPVHDMKRLMELSQKDFRELRSHPLFEFWQRQGLCSVVEYANDVGILPTHNFRDGTFKEAESLGGYEMEAKNKIGDTACMSCPMSCGNVCLVKNGKYTGTVVEGPEYETTAMFGSNLGVKNFDMVIRANYMCDELGIDTISTGNLIGAVIEAYELGMISLDDLDGTNISWGNEEAILSLIEKIANREGIGNILADGSKALLERWPEMGKILSQVKGLEQSAYDCRGAISMALAYGTSDIGAHHARAWTVARELEMGSDWPLSRKADLVIYHQTVRPLFDMLGVCRLPWIELGFSEDHYVEYYKAITGIGTTMEELSEKAGVLYDLTRLINIRLGATRKDDYPPERAFNTPVKTGPLAGKCTDREEYEKILDLYYEKRGWDKDGNPGPESVKRFEEMTVFTDE